MAIQSSTMLAPTRGWNDRDNITTMEEGYAVVLDNVNPKARECLSRGGTELYVDLPTTDQVRTLMVYNGTRPVFFAASGDSIYDITTTTPVASVLPSPSTNPVYDSIMYGTVDGGKRVLYVVNGSDKPMHFDGTVWEIPPFTIAGKTEPEVEEITKGFFSIVSHGRRLYFLQKHKLSFWYLDGSAIPALSGELKEFPLHGVFPFGGNVCAMGSWSRDSGSGTQDLLCIFTDKGEVAIYEGDPITIDTFTLVSKFNVGVPVGFAQSDDHKEGINSTRVLRKIGADLFITTSNGLISMSQILSSGFSAPSTSVSDTIKNSFSNSYESTGTDFGWQILEYPRGGQLIVNVPSEASEEGIIRSVQFVMNTINQAWCRWTNLDYACWGLYNEELYCAGNSGLVVKANTGHSDLGTPISCRVITAYLVFGSVNFKKFQQLEAFLETRGDVVFYLDVDVDYEFDLQTYFTLIENSSISLWDEAIWDSSVWSKTIARTKVKIDLSHEGTAAAVHCYFQTHDYPVYLTNFIVTYEVSKYI